VSRALIGLAGAGAALFAFAVLLVAFLAAPLIVLGVFAAALGAAERARRRR
jgi:hypothetical protein